MPVGYLDANVWLVVRTVGLELIREVGVRDTNVGVITIGMALGRGGEGCNISEARSSGSHSKTHLY